MIFLKTIFSIPHSIQGVGPDAPYGPEAEFPLQILTSDFCPLSHALFALLYHSPSRIPNSPFMAIPSIFSTF